MHDRDGAPTRDRLARAPSRPWCSGSAAAIAVHRRTLRPTAAVLTFEANMIGGDNDNYSALT